MTHIGGDYQVALRSLSLRPHLTPSVQFATVEVLWLWRFGAALEATLSDAARGNRLRLVNRKREVNRSALGCFEFWPPEYRAFREDGFEVARRMLSKGRSRCLVATFDLASYYDEIDPHFLLDTAFIARVAEQSIRKGLEFDAREYGTATGTLLDAFGRYRTSCAALTGIQTSKGVPIGCLSSKVIANVALATLDENVRARSDVVYYARYVDDILLVARAPRRASSSAQAIAKAFLPLAAPRKRFGRKELSLDAGLLERPGSAFRLQPSKLRGYLLTGRRGRDFLDTVERDVKLIASERRAFLLPDGLGSDSPLTALFLGSDTERPVRVLREVDQLKVERYAASVALGKASVGVELLDQPDSAEWCNRQLSPLAGHITSPEQWLEFIDLALRALTVCIRANDLQTARTILRRHVVQFDRLALKRSKSSPTWNGRQLSWPVAIEGLRRWYEHRRLEEIASSLPLTEIASNGVRRFLKKLIPVGLNTETLRIGPEGIRSRVELLHDADLRTADRETDRQRLAGDELRRHPRFGRLSALLRRAASTEERATSIGRFLEVCHQLRDSTYRDMSDIDVFLMTRPPSQFDIACRWSKAGRSMDDLSSVTNGVRGNRYSGTTVKQGGPNIIDIATPGIFPNPLQDVLIVLGNIRTGDEYWTAAARGAPVLTKHRIAAIGRIVNEAIRLKHWKNKPTLLVLPELALPKRLLRPLARRLVHEGVNLVAGLEYAASPAGVVNEAVGVFAPGYSVAAVCWWPKTLPARGEERELLKLSPPVQFARHTDPPPLVNTDWGAVSILICSELLDVNLRAGLLGRLDILVVPAWNPDTTTFDHTIQTTANDLHCYVAVANNAKYSDSRLQVPADKRHERDGCRLISRADDDVIAVEVSAEQLRQFQLQSLADPLVKRPKYKPLPPGYVFRRMDREFSPF